MYLRRFRYHLAFERTKTLTGVLEGHRNLRQSPDHPDMSARRQTPRKDPIPRTNALKLLFPALLSHQPKVLPSLRAHLGTYYVVAMGPKNREAARTGGGRRLGDSTGLYPPIVTSYSDVVLWREEMYSQYLPTTFYDNTWKGGDGRENKTWRT